MNGNIRLYIKVLEDNLYLIISIKKESQSIWRHLKRNLSYDLSIYLNRSMLLISQIIVQIRILDPRACRSFKNVINMNMNWSLR